MPRTHRPCVPPRAARRVAPARALTAPAFAVMVLAAVAMPALAGESVVLKIEETGEALSQTEGALFEGRRAKAKLEAQVTEIEREVLHIRRELVDAAAETQDIEARIGALETHLEALTQRRAEKRQALTRRRAELTRTLAALQRIGRTPPDLLLLMPASLQDISRARLLLGAVAKALDARTVSLSEELRDLARIGEEIAAQRQLIDIEAARLEVQRARLGVLLARKTVARDRTEARQGRAEAMVAQLAEEAGTLQELLSRLEEERNARLKSESESVPIEAPPSAGPGQAARAPADAVRSGTLGITVSPSSADAESAAPGSFVAPPAAVPTREEVPAGEREIAVTDGAAGSAGSASAPDGGAESAEIGQVAALTPARPSVSASRGAFTMPARGKLVSRFNETTAFGLSTKGIIIETRARAQIVAPFDGRVAFAGPFREYGLLLIIDHGEGYHTLLAGMGRIDALLDQRVLAGEPVGVMGASDEEKLRLYVELRSKGHPINPLPWLAVEKIIKVSG